MSQPIDELALYDQARLELRRRLSDAFPPDFALEDILTAYAYWVCTAIRCRGQEWEATLQEYVDSALVDADPELRAEQIELELLRGELARARGPLLDVGAGWGRLSGLYQQAGLPAFYAEPAMLGCQLLRRNGLEQTARCNGQQLSFATGAFGCVLIGWVLHHDSPNAPCAAILNEAARVSARSARLLSVEPLSADFDAARWQALVAEAGFEIERVEPFFDELSAQGKPQRYALLAARRG